MSRGSNSKANNYHAWLERLDISMCAWTGAACV